METEIQIHSMASKLAVLKLALATENETLSLFTKQERLRQRKVSWSHSQQISKQQQQQKFLKKQL